MTENTSNIEFQVSQDLFEDQESFQVDVIDFQGDITVFVGVKELITTPEKSLLIKKTDGHFAAFSADKWISFETKPSEETHEKGGFYGQT